MQTLYLVLPKANPDFEHLYDDVRDWWLEIDENNIPKRELGFDQSGKVIVASPLHNNYGFWTDSGERIGDENYTLISHNDFAKAWGNFESEYLKRKSNT